MPASGSERTEARRTFCSSDQRVSSRQSTRLGTKQVQSTHKHLADNLGALAFKRLFFPLDHLAERFQATANPFTDGPVPAATRRSRLCADTDDDPSQSPRCAPSPSESAAFARQPPQERLGDPR